VFFSAFFSIADSLPTKPSLFFIGPFDGMVLNSDVGADVKPVRRLVRAGELKLRPGLLPTLVTASVNTWIGTTAPGESVSSGLHHDYHDNLYVLLRGRKRFRLCVHGWISSFCMRDDPQVHSRQRN
jgi:hypothetical protein